MNKAEKLKLSLRGLMPFLSSTYPMEKNTKKSKNNIIASLALKFNTKVIRANKIIWLISSTGPPISGIGFL